MVHLLCYDIGKGDRMSEMVKWINKHWRQINGYGSYIEGESGMYVVVPVSMIAKEFGITVDEVIYGVEE